MAIVAPLLLAIAIGCCTYQKEKKRKKKEMERGNKRNKGAPTTIIGPSLRF
jgi:hypothetical protein